MKEKLSAWGKAINWKKELWYWGRVAFMLFTLYICFGVVWGLGRVGGRSMEPTYRDGDYFLMERFGEVQHGDVVVVRHAAEDGKDIVKRVIGLPGDVLQLSADGTVTRNGVVLDEPYIQGVTYPYGLDAPVVVQEGHLFVMGDNREHSTDSRAPGTGQVDNAAVVGRLTYKLFNLKEIFARGGLK